MSIAFIGSAKGSVVAGIEDLNAKAPNLKRFVIIAEQQDGSYESRMWGQDMPVERLLLYAKELELWAERVIEANRKK